MGTFLKAMLSSLNLQQVLTFIVGTAGGYAIHAFAPVALQPTLLSLDSGLVGLISVLVRTPSAAGGTTNSAQVPQIPAK